MKPSAALRRAAGRAKSDVANKLISMCLHLVSKKMLSTDGLRVDSEAYQLAVVQEFAEQCVYCREPLAVGAVAVEHLDAMNRLRLGLHVPGNVLLSCRPCNSAKRRSDGALHLQFGPSGWEDFLQHDGTACDRACRTCSYWLSRHVVTDVASFLSERRQHIARFRERYAHKYPTTLSPDLREEVWKVYGDAQKAAESSAAVLFAKWHSSLSVTEAPASGSEGQVGPDPVWWTPSLT
jgi:hypothetical protein